jgi:hypothetical protein
MPYCAFYLQQDSHVNMVEVIGIMVVILLILWSARRSYKEDARLAQQAAPRMAPPRMKDTSSPAREPLGESPGTPSVR